MKTIDDLKADWALACYNSRHSGFHLIQAGDELIEALEKELYGWRNQRIYFGAGFRDAQGNWTPAYMQLERYDYHAWKAHQGEVEALTRTILERDKEVTNLKALAAGLVADLNRAEQEVRHLHTLIRNLYDESTKL